MTWQSVIIAQVVVSAVMTIFTRRLALTDRKLFFVIGSLSYGMVAMMGFIYSVVFSGGLPSFPASNAWPFLLLEGFAIPIWWLLQYKIIGLFGASNAVLITMLNYAGAALLGFSFLDEPFSAGFFIGSLLILSSIFIAFWVQPDTTHHISVGLSTKVLLVLGMATSFSIGTLAEKQAIDLIGVWNYASFGWALQFICAMALLSLYGRHEWAHVTTKSVRGGLLLGLMTSVAGGLFIYALSTGTLSHTIVAASGKIALTMMLAAVFLNERNSLALRFLAFVLSVAGLLFLIA